MRTKKLQDFVMNNFLILSLGSQESHSASWRELEGRLIGAAQICLSLGFIPENILLGITAALLFENENDADRHLSFMRRALNPTTLLTHVLSLRRGESLERVLSERLGKMMTSHLEQIIGSVRRKK